MLILSNGIPGALTMHHVPIKKLPMKYPFLLFVALCLLTSCDPQAPTGETAEMDAATVAADIEAVHALIQDSFDDLWSGLDSTKIAKYHTDDFILLENGIVWNNDSIRHFMMREREAMEREQYQRLNAFDFIKSEHRQESIWVAYHNYGTWVKGTDTLGTAYWLESAVAIPQDGTWKLEQLHSTRASR